MLSHNHCLNSLNSLLESMQFRNQTPQRLTCPCWHIGVAGILQQVDEIYDTVPSRRCNDAELPEMAAQCIDEHGPLPDQQVAHAMMQERGLRHVPAEITERPGGWMSPRVAAPVLDEHLTIVRLRPDNATIEFACAGDPSKEVRMNNAITAIRDTALSPAANSEQLATITCCPRCRAKLEPGGDLWRCARADCVYARTGFPVVSGQPVLVDFDRSIFRRANYEHGSGSVRRRPDESGRFLRTSRAQGN